MGSLAGVLPEDVAVVEEAVTTTNTYLERLGALRNASGYFGHRGWALGWGLGCAIGVKLAWPGRPVLALLGDGAALYGIQGLWTAARLRLPVTFVICNNAQYQILKVGARGMALPHALEGRFEGLDLVGPDDVARLVAMARSTFDYVVVDMPLQLVRWTEPLLKRLDRVLLVTIASAFKYEAPGQVGFLDLVLPVLEGAPQADLVAVGPDCEGAWKAASERSVGASHFRK